MFVDTDLSLTKTIPIQSLALSIQASFLNAFNHTNWNVGGGAPGDYSTITSPGYTAATLANNPRIIQFRTQLQF